ncbi:MAG: immunoglobulin domain-containing protein, partial [Verrucomicrobia bacterium]|nr:immunoglobulin domain-containing protein [Verrucomicrobiota bacterium]
MKRTRAKTLLLAGWLGLVLGAGFLRMETLAQQPPANFVWARQIGSTNLDQSLTLAADPGGNVYVTGQFQNTANFGTTNLVSRGSFDSFLAKYNTAGSLVWLIQEGGSGSDQAFGVALDGATNIYLAGSFSGASTIANVPITAMGGLDVFLAKYTRDGTPIWVATGGSTGTDIHEGVAADSNGNVCIVGRFGGTATFGSHSITSSGLNDVFIVKYDSAGNALWARSAGGLTNDYGHAVAMDSAGNVYVAGEFSQSATFDTVTLTSSGLQDSFLAKYDSAGNFQWVRQQGSSGSDLPWGVATDSAGNILLAGQYAGSLTIGSDTLTNSGTDSFFAKYAPDGTALWARRAGGPNTDFPRRITMDNLDNVYAVGTFTGTATFGSTNVTAVNADIYVTKLDSAGNFLWTQRAVGSLIREPRGIATDANRNVYIGGSFVNTLNFGVTNLATFGSNDLFFSKMVQQAEPPSIIAQSGDATAYAGTNISFSVSAVGTPSPAYRWQRDGVDLPGATNAVLSLTNVQTGNAGAYLAVVSNIYGAVTSAPIMLAVVLPVPAAIITSPQGTNVISGVAEPVTFTVVAEGSPVLKYQWRRNGTNLPAATNDTFTLYNVRGSNAGNYSVVVTNYFGAVTSAVAVLAVETRPVILIPPADRTVSAGDGTIFSASALGEPPLRYQWQFQGMNIPGATNANLLISSVQASHAGAYQVVVANGFGLTTSTAAMLAVVPDGSPPGPPVILLQPASLAVFQGTAAGFSVVVSNAGPLRFQWRFNGADLSDATNSLFVVSSAQPADAGGYHVVVAGDGGSVTSAPALLEVNGPPVIDMPPQSQLAVVGSNVTFTVGVSGTGPLGYQWRFKGNNIFNATNTALTLSGLTTNHSGAYSVVVSNAAGSVTSSPAILTVGFRLTINSGPGGAVFRDPDLPAYTNGSIVTLSAVPASNYFFSVWGGSLTGGSNPVSIVITSNRTVSAAFSPILPPAISLQPASRTVTAGANVSFTVAATGTPPMSYQWRFDGVDIPGATNVSLTLPDVQAANAGSYTVFVSNFVGSVTSAAATLTVTVAPTDIALGGTNVFENQPTNTLVGTLTAQDPDSSDTAAFTLVAGTGGDDNASFTISNGTNLVTAAKFDYETKNSYGIRVRVTDSGGLFFEKSFTIAVTDVNEAALAIAQQAYLKASNTGG